jgi:hypothetical protein
LEKAWNSYHLPREAEDRDEEYADLESLPKKEGMRKRVKVIGNDGLRRFSENLAPLRGLVVKNVGKNWDKLYSELCKLVSPTGSNIERHVHQHIPDFIETKTKMVDGEVYCLAGGRDVDAWMELNKYIGYYYSHWHSDGYFYYVHPLSRCICRKKIPRQKEVKLAPTFIREKKNLYAKLGGIWWKLNYAKQEMVEASFYDHGTQKFYNKFVPKYTDVIIDTLARDSYIRRTYGYEAKSIYGGDFVVLSKRQLSRNELKKLGVKNDAIVPLRDKPV